MMIVEKYTCRGARERETEKGGTILKKKLKINKQSKYLVYIFFAFRIRWFDFIVSLFLVGSTEVG
jgi:hypothetical protein